jgi:hypothetical protein
VLGLPWPTRAEVGYTPVVPGAAAGPADPLDSIPMVAGQQVAIYFVALDVRHDHGQIRDRIRSGPNRRSSRPD